MEEVEKGGRREEAMEEAMEEAREEARDEGEGRRRGTKAEGQCGPSPEVAYDAAASPQPKHGRKLTRPHRPEVIR